MPPIHWVGLGTGTPKDRDEVKKEMEDLEKRAIEDLPVVSSVRLHAGDKTHKVGVYANLRCCAASPYGGCGAKLVGPIRKTIERPWEVPAGSLAQPLKSKPQS